MWGAAMWGAMCGRRVRARPSGGAALPPVADRVDLDLDREAWLDEGRDADERGGGTDIPERLAEDGEHVRRT
jgi:hypothetical protein